MQIWPKTAIAALLCGLAWSGCWAQDNDRPIDIEMPSAQSTHRGRPRHSTLDADDRLSVIAAAMDWKKSRRGGSDCSHLVHAIYEWAGFPYHYANSDDLYDGIQGFQRVSRPQPGDLVVWHGHVGIVIQPSHHAFFSFLTAGPGIDDYRNRYWKGRGEPRFYRYVKNDPCAGCVVARNRAGEWK